MAPPTTSAHVMLMPHCSARLALDFFVCLSILLVAFAMPMTLAYPECAPTSGWGHVPLNMADGLWYLFILVNFRTGLLSAGRLSCDPWIVAKHYVKGWLVFDLCTAWPTGLVFVGTLRWMSGALNVMRILRLPSVIVKFQKWYMRIVRMVKVFLVITLLSHILSCCWRFAQRVDEREWGGHHLWWRRYIMDQYFVLMTMTTVGYGDIHPLGTFSRFFSNLVMLISPVFFGSIVSFLTHATRETFDEKVEGRVAEAMRFLRRRRVPDDLQRRVEHNLRHHLNHEHVATLSPELLSGLSPAVQRELSLALLSNTVLQFKLFQGAQHTFIAEIAHAHLWVQALPGDIVAEDGQLMQEVVFVIQGRLLMSTYTGSSSGIGLDDNSDEDSEIGTGAWFGEACLFQETIQTASIIAIVETELAVLCAKDYCRIIENYPRLLKQHQLIQQALQDGSMSLTELQHTAPQHVENRRNLPWIQVIWKTKV